MKKVIERERGRQRARNIEREEQDFFNPRLCLILS